MNILVTGANSYLGAHVCYQLRQRGHIIFRMDSHGRPIGNGGDEMLVEAIAHLGWFSKAGDGEPAAQEYCLWLTANLLSPLKRIRRPVKVVFASTASVYPMSTLENYSLMSDEDTPIAPSCTYTKAKAVGEEVVRVCCPKSHLILRMGSLMGLGSTPGGRTKIDVIVNAFASDGYTKGKIQVWHPSAWKPVVHVLDAARIIVDGLERKEWVGTVNVAWRCIRAIDIATRAAYHTGAEIEVIERAGPIRSHRISTDRLLAELPGLPFYTLGDAICEFSDYSPGPRDATVPW